MIGYHGLAIKAGVMKKLLFLMAWVTILTGCVSSFIATKSTRPFQCESNLESTLAAKCIQDNANNRSDGDYNALPVEEGSRPNVLQVHVRSSKTECAAIFEIEPIVNGSLVTGWISDDYIGTRERSQNIYVEGCCVPSSPYNDTVKLIKELLSGSSSAVRKESYSYIRFSECILDYKVSGTYPIGTPYEIKFSDIDFTSLNYQGSKVGKDYSDYIVLNFNNPANYKTFSDELTVHTIVMDAASNEQAQALFKAFLHLGEICGVGKSTL
jgi:hypothetical protein